VLGCAGSLGARSGSPRDANPERPTVATHAYSVAGGYAELEQGTRVFGPGYLRTSAGAGVGDLGVSLKLSRGVSSRSTVALVPSVTFPTGDRARGLGAGRMLSSVVAVLSADLPASLHFDFNTRPVGVGAGTPQWFTSVGFSRAGTIGAATELFDFTSGASGPRQRGFLAAAVVRCAAWAVLDARGAVGLSQETPNQALVGLTTNLGRIFK